MLVAGSQKETTVGSDVVPVDALPLLGACVLVGMHVFVGKSVLVGWSQKRTLLGEDRLALLDCGGVGAPCGEHPTHCTCVGACVIMGVCTLLRLDWIEPEGKMVGL